MNESGDEYGKAWRSMDWNGMDSRKRRMKRDGMFSI